MPNYAYTCLHCDWSCFEFYKSLPENPSAPITCRGCGKEAQRHFAKDAGSSIMIGNAKSEGFEKMSVLSHAADGSAFVRDANNRPKEVRTFRDVEKYLGKDNHLGKPKMTQRRNRETGVTEWVPMRDSNGSIIRDSERLVPISSDPNRRPSQERTGLTEAGVAKPKYMVDPETNELIAPSDLWSDDGSAKGYLGHGGRVLNE